MKAVPEQRPRYRHTAIAMGILGADEMFPSLREDGKKVILRPTRRAGAAPPMENNS